MKDTTSATQPKGNPTFKEVIPQTPRHNSTFLSTDKYEAAETELRRLQQSPEANSTDIILLNLNQLGMSALEALPWIKEYTSETGIIILTQSSKQEAHTWQIGPKAASRNSLRSKTLDQLRENIKTIVNEDESPNRNLSKFHIKLLKQHTAPESKKTILSQREIEVLRLISQGLQKKEVAEQLGISTRTVATHVEKIFEKLNVKNAPAAVSQAYRLGIFCL